MLVKIALGLLFIAMICSAYYFEPARDRSLLGGRPTDGPRLKLMTWNIGYADLDDDSRAKTKDLKAVADTILKYEPDAVALQELTGEDQLEVLLKYLQNRYRGTVGQFGNIDRVEAILVKDAEARFEDVSSAASGRYALSASFRFRKELPEIVLISAHTDAYSAARRRIFTGDIVDWARERTKSSIVFIAGDFNFDLTARNSTSVFTDNLKHDSEAYSYILKYFRDLGREAGGTSLSDRRIDYIFSPPETTLFRKAEVLRDAAVGRMDHCPLFIEVAL